MESFGTGDAGWLARNADVPWSGVGVASYAFGGPVGLEVLSVTIAMSSPDPENFNATIRSLDLGEAMLDETVFTAYEVRRAPTHLIERPLTDVVLSLCTGGTVDGSYAGRPFHIETGDFMVLRYVEEFDYHSTGQTFIAVHFPEALLPPSLRRRLGAVTGVPFDADAYPLAAATAGFLRSLMSGEPPTGQVHGPSIGRALIALVSGVIAEIPGVAEPEVDVALREQAIAFIAEHLRDIDVAERVTTVADADPGEVARVFAAVGETIAGEIEAQRLDAFVEELRTSPPEVRVSVLARSFGFTDDGAFARAFAGRFGTSVAEMRYSVHG